MTTTPYHFTLDGQSTIRDNYYIPAGPHCGWTDSAGRECVAQLGHDAPHPPAHECSEHPRLPLDGEPAAAPSVCLVCVEHTRRRRHVVMLGVGSAHATYPHDAPVGARSDWQQR